MDAKNASLVRSRLPIRTRVWATSLTNPGETATDSAARAMTYDLLQVGLVDAPLILNFNPEEFEQTYQVPVPETTFDKRLFALGARCLCSVAVCSSRHFLGSDQRTSWYAHLQPQFHAGCGSPCSDRHDSGRCRQAG